MRPIPETSNILDVFFNISKLTYSRRHTKELEAKPELSPKKINIIKMNSMQDIMTYLP